MPVVVVLSSAYCSLSAREADKVADSFHSVAFLYFSLAELFTALYEEQGDNKEDCL